MPIRARYSTFAFPLLLALLFLGIAGLGLAAQDVTSTPPSPQRTSHSAVTKTEASSTTHITSSSAGNSHKSASAVASHASLSPTPTSTFQSETCRSASINYVTNRLPQQCWTGSKSSTSIAVVAEETGNPGGISSTGILTTSDPSETSQNNIPVPETHSNATGTDTSPVDPIASQQTSTPGSSTTSESTVSVTVAADTPTDSQTEADAESLLDQAEFLSFEEWKRKKMNLEKSEQNAGKLADEGRKAGRQDQRPGINHALDSLGDDGEIYLDLSSFGGANRPGEQNQYPPASGFTPPQAEPLGESSPDSPAKLSRDAGKTCKERSNYASFDCAANVLKTNPKCKSASSILVENKDSYMLNKCSEDNKFLIVEMCENIIIDTVVLANFEFFSSMFRTFRVSVSDRYPVKPDKWHDLGTFEARNGRDIQPFLIKNCPIFARYLRIEFLTHYGNEYYCPVSLLRVHGTTMYEDWRRHNQGRDADEEEELVPVESIQEGLQAGTAQETISAHSGVLPDVKEDGELKQAVLQSAESTATQASARQSVPEDPSSSSPPTPDVNDELPQSDEELMTTKSPPENSPTDPSSASAATTKVESSSTSESLPLSPQTFANSTKTAPVAPTKTSSTTVTSVVPYNSSVIRTEQTNPNATDENPISSLKEDPNFSKTSSSTTTLSATLKQAQASFAPTPYQPPTQESFFKSIHKRLSFLEANSTLSLQYIESQSALLRDAFAKVEKRQINKTSSFLESLNATVTAELAHFKSEYDRLWQSAVMELASQREESKKERELLGERVRLLAEEMGNQKRLMAVQATLMLLCLGLVVFGKVGSGGSTVDSGLLHGMQEIVAKAKEAKMGESEKTHTRWRWESPWSSPSRRSKSSTEVGRTPEQQGKSGFDDDGDGLRIISTQTSASSYEEGHSEPAANGASPEVQQTLRPPDLVKHHTAPTTPSGKG